MSKYTLRNPSAVTSEFQDRGVLFACLSLLAGLYMFEKLFVFDKLCYL